MTTRTRTNAARTMRSRRRARRASAAVPASEPTASPPLPPRRPASHRRSGAGTAPPAWEAYSEAGHPDGSESDQRPVETARVDQEFHVGALDAQVVHAGQRGEAVRRRGEVGGDRETRQVAHLGETADLDGAPVPDDAHAIGQRLDLGEDVAREKRRAALLAELDEALAEHRVHQGVEAGGGLVEQQQLDVGREGGDQRHLLPVALRVRACLLGRVGLEALQQVRPPPSRRARPAAVPAGRSPPRR